MKVIVNNETREIKVASIGTLIDVVNQIEVTLPQGFVITEIKLNDKILETNWYHTASKTYLLDDDVLEMTTQESTVIAYEVLKKSKDDFQVLIESFREIADAFRIQNEADSNKRFIQGIENLQWYLKVLEDASLLLGKPLSSIIYNDVQFTEHINDLGQKLDQVIETQCNKDWVMLADMIEYEMIPSLEKLGILYDILKI